MQNSDAPDLLSRNEETPHLRFEPSRPRRACERNAELDWGIIVEKIVHNNDQQASVALQQKLKSSSSEQRTNIINAILLRAFPLMSKSSLCLKNPSMTLVVNRFGNFLVQKCFEHGTTEQIEILGLAIKGNVLVLSKDPFGCHVVQKAFDNVSDTLKADFVTELLGNIRETVTHRQACHVWQKLFEVRWAGRAPELMSFVNRDLVGQWTQVAMGETGSLVVQNIFENCLEAEKRPCTEEVLDNLSTIIRGQWGNWVVQHVRFSFRTSQSLISVDC